MILHYIIHYRETTHIKKLARHLLDQRTELEQFFIEALAQVKREITSNRQVCIILIIINMHYKWSHVYYCIIRQVKCICTCDNNNHI